MKKIRNMNMLTKTIVILLVLVVVFLLSFQQIFKAYEDGILEVSAGSQDGYVELVINQIRLKENRSDEKIITSIIRTLDSSSNKYWTFSKGSDILFVKNVLETNRYKGISASSYYTSKSARKFVRSLNANVSHALITVEGKKYMASGALFVYRGQSYRLILLTSPEVLLDNNTYQSAKMAMITMIGLLIILFAVAPMLIAWYYMRLEKINHTQQEDLAQVHKALAASNRRLNDQVIYHEREQVWNISVLDAFLDDLKKRKLSCVTVRCPFSEDAKGDFIRNGYKLIDHHYILFDDGDTLVLLFVHMSAQDIREIFAKLNIAIAEVKEYAYGSEKI